MAPLLLLPLLPLLLLVPTRAGAVSPARPSDRACVGSFSSRSSAARHTCLDISAICERLRCDTERVCALDPAGTPTCLPDTIRAARHCGSEDDRLARPCPDGAAVLGFGRGCTFCDGTATAEASEAAGAEAEVAATSQSRYIGAGRQREPRDGLFRALTPPRPTRPPQNPAQNNGQALNACVVIHIGSGEFKEECIDISSPCQQRSCPTGTVCGLNLNEQIECFPDSVKDFENCGSEEFRLFQPCPDDAGILGFGQGCTFCKGFDNLFETPTVSRACVVVHIGSGEFKEECVDISSPCQQRNCPSGTVCGLNLKEQIECFPESVKDFENCGSEEFRLSQPCPADAGILGFGQGCTFCEGGFPFEPPTDESATAPNACVVIHVGLGRFRRECYDISSQCSRRNCPSDTVCGLDLSENTVCFSSEVKDFENCGPDSFRLEQPCPAGGGIRGFGQGCTFCVGENNLQTAPARPPTGLSTRPPSRPSIGLPTRPTTRPTTKPPTRPPVACISRRLANGQLRRGCRDITADCRRLACRSGLTCALDRRERPRCFPPLQLPLRNCGPPSQRLARPCPDGAEVVAFGAGCTFCRPNDIPTTPTPTPEPTPLACFVSRAERYCVDISKRCRRLRCGRGAVCALDATASVRCLNRVRLGQPSCGTDWERLTQPCSAGAPQAFAAGCTFCQVRACVARPGGRSQCVDISRQCARIRCGAGAECVLNWVGRVICLRAGQGVPFCGTEQQRLSSPCGYRNGGAIPIAYGPKCNYCY